MIAPESTPLLLVLCTAYLLLTGLIVLAWGRRMRPYGPALIWSGLLAAASGIGLALHSLIETGQRLSAWHRGWIGPRQEAQSITVGLLQDLPALAFSALLVLMAGVLLV